MLLYGCEVGAGAEGAAFIDQLALMTGADIAASTDKTGGSTLGGNWDLEVVHGSVEASAAVSGELSALYSQVLSIASATVSFSNPGNFVSVGGISNATQAAPLTNPFGLSDVGNSANPTLADLDGDGDLDALVGNSNGNTLYFQNTGNATAASFAAPLTNPFGLSDVGYRA